MPNVRGSLRGSLNSYQGSSLRSSRRGSVQSHIESMINGISDWNNSVDDMWSSASSLQGFAPEGLEHGLNVGNNHKGCAEKTQEDAAHKYPHEIARLVTDMRLCLIDLTGTKHGTASSPAAANRAIEKASVLIYDSMSAPSRTFHDVQHVYDIQNFGANSIQKLAAFFHDVIYYSVDGGLSSMQADCLKGVIVEEDGGKTIKVSSTACDDDRHMALVMHCFGFEPGQILNPFCGLNEFLSAAAAVRCLEDLLRDSHLLQISACIEATIPFRKKDAEGKTCSVLLHERLVEVNRDMDLGMSDDDVIKTTQDAVALANSDVMSFSTTDHGRFLSGTWNLLPESNISLRTDGGSYISCFAMALKKMLGFLSTLDPAVIYESFHNVPNTRKMALLESRAKKNLEVSTRYLQLKLLGVCVVAALAELTGGDAPLVMFVRGMHVGDPDAEEGDTESESEGTDEEETDEQRVERLFAKSNNVLSNVAEDDETDDLENSFVMSDFSSTRKNTREAGNNRASIIPNFGLVKKSTTTSDRCEITYELLKYGRSSASKFDLINSPLAAYLYGLMGESGASKSLKYCVCPMDSTNAKLLLDSIPPEAVRVISKSCSRTALTRSDELLEISMAY